jgi:uncharacterized protein YjbI with pentapeptide repeats
MGQEQHPAQQEKPRTPGERGGELVDLLVGDWRPSEQQILQWVRIAVAVGSVLLVVLLILYVIGLIFGIPLLNLLTILAIPITVGAAVPLLNWLQKKRELDVEHQRAQDEALQAYLDQMSHLLTDKELRRTTDWLDEARITARARSLAALSRLDGERKSSVLQFLYEAQLINRRESTFVEGVTYELGPARIVGLSGADLRSADLRYIYLSDAALNGALLDNADLREAKLRDIDLGGAYLSGADLRGADLRGASLINAELQRKDELNLSGAALSGADLSGADLSGADLSGADLSGADLRGARRMTQEQVDLTIGSNKAELPEGLNRPQWWSKGIEEQRRIVQESEGWEDEENSDPS